MKKYKKNFKELYDEKRIEEECANRINKANEAYLWSRINGNFRFISLIKSNCDEYKDAFAKYILQSKYEECKQAFLNIICEDKQTLDMVCEMYEGMRDSIEELNDFEINYKEIRSH